MLCNVMETNYSILSCLVSMNGVTVTVTIYG